MENYIVINGKKFELTEEQLQALGIEIKKKRNNEKVLKNNEKLKYVDAMTSLKNRLYFLEQFLIYRSKLSS